MAQLEPGPIPAITSDWFDQSVDSPGFTDLVTGCLGGLDDLESSLDGFLDPNASIDDGLPDDGLDPVLDGVDSSLALIGQTADGWQPDLIQAAYDQTGEQLTEIFSIVPAEAWQDVPPPQTFDDAGVVTDTSNPMDATVTDPGGNAQSSFAVGQVARFTIQIHPLEGGGGVFGGVTVIENDTLNGQVRDPFTAGGTDQFGFLVVSRTFGPDDVGSWQATFYAVQPNGSQLPGPTIQWEVTPAPAGTVAPVTPAPAPVTAPPPTPAPPPIQVSVSLVSNAPGRAYPNFLVGDTWTLTVIGPPNAPVVVAGSFNTQTLSPAQLGSTGNDGVFTLAGVMAAANIGLWQETYNVGGIDWDGALLFSVNAAPGGGV